MAISYKYTSKLFKLLNGEKKNAKANKMSSNACITTIKTVWARARNYRMVINTII